MRIGTFQRLLLLAALLLLPAGRAIALEPEKVVPPTQDTPENNGPTSPSRVLPGEPAIHKNYWLPLFEIPAFEFALNQVDRQLYPGPTYESTWESGWDHVTNAHWTVDQDAFAINQIGHPYQGAMYYNFARSCSLNFWESYIYTNLGSYIWETYGETTNPSINDMVASGTAGSFLGEVLFRMSSLVLESGEENEKPGFWRELGAGVIAPPAELNRLLFGDKYGPILEHRAPPVFVQVGAGGGWNNTVKDPGNAHRIAKDVGAANFSMDYGMPGKSGYKYLRPMDYFHLDVGGLVENSSLYTDLGIRSMLFGAPYEAGDEYRGIWGLYGSYNYSSPQVFRYSMTSAGLGTTFQCWLSRKIALQGTGMAGVGYGSAGTIEPANSEADFHYGLAPESLVALRTIFGTRAMLDVTARAFYVTDVGSSKAPGTERIGSVDSSFSFRLFGPHSVGVHCVLSSRNAHYQAPLPDRHQLVGTLLVAYTYLTDMNFGAVHWGNHAE